MGGRDGAKPFFFCCFLLSLLGPYVFYAVGGGPFSCLLVRNVLSAFHFHGNPMALYSFPTDRTSDERNRNHLHPVSHRLVEGCATN